MIEKKERGILLFNKISSENNLYIKILTENDEITSGLIFGGSTKKKKNIYQIGFFLDIILKNKNKNFPNSISAELSKPYYYNILNNKYKLHCLLSIMSLLNLSIIEGQKINGIFRLSEEIIKLIENNEKWIIDFFLYLLNLLKLIGYDIDYITNFSKKFFNLNTLQFQDQISSNVLIFPHKMLARHEKLNNHNAKSFFQIFELILQNHHLNNMNLNIPINYLKFKKLILDFLSKK